MKASTAASNDIRTKRTKAKQNRESELKLTMVQPHRWHSGARWLWPLPMSQQKAMGAAGMLLRGKSGPLNTTALSKSMSCSWLAVGWAITLLHC